MLNRAPTKSLQGTTPYEAWYGKKPSVEHLRVFGCAGHVKIIGPEVRKLSDRSVKMVFLGYAEGTKGYRMYDPVSKKLSISRDVIFEENKGWDWNFERDSQDRPEFLIADFDSTVVHPTIGTVQGSPQPEVSEPASPPSTQVFPMFGDPQQSPTHTASSSNSAAQWGTPPGQQSSDAEEMPPRFRTLSNLYDTTEEV